MAEIQNTKIKISFKKNPKTMKQNFRLAEFRGVGVPFPFTPTSLSKPVPLIRMLVVEFFDALTGTHKIGIYQRDGWAIPQLH